MDLGLRGRKAIVTGATRGIGRAIVELFAAEGADIGFCARRPDEVEATRASLCRHGVNVVGGIVDVRDGATYRAWLERTAQTLGGCDIFVPNPTRRLRRRLRQRADVARQLRGRRHAHRTRL